MVIDARLLGSERYRFDSISNLVPEDLALGWGPMSDNRVLRRVDISQSNRFYFWCLESGALTTQGACEVMLVREVSVRGH